jgi:hypothetical protein
MIVGEQHIENALRVFFHEAKIPRKYLSIECDLRIMKKCVSAFIKALEEIEPVEKCYGFDETKVFEG